MWAASEGSQVVLELLAAAGFDLSDPDEEGCSPAFNAGLIRRHMQHQINALLASFFFFLFLLCPCESKSCGDGRSCDAAVSFPPL